VRFRSSLIFTKMANQLIDGDQAIVATCITAATVLAPAQGRADFIFQSLSANNPATVQAGSSRNVPVDVELEGAALLALSR